MAKTDALYVMSTLRRPIYVRFVPTDGCLLIHLELTPSPDGNLLAAGQNLRLDPTDAVMACWEMVRKGDKIHPTLNHEIRSAVRPALQFAWDKTMHEDGPTLLLEEQPM